MENRQFQLINAQHAVSRDGVHVEFVGRNELAYGTTQRLITLTVETVIASDGAPDGVIVQCDDEPKWTDGQTLTQAEFAAIMLDLERASVPLKTKFHWPYL